MQSFGSQRMYAHAIKEARRLLAELGERLPTVNKLTLAMECRRARHMVQSRSDEELSFLEPILDDRRRWIAKILQAAAVYGWSGDKSFAELVFMRMMRVTLSCGSCESTPFAFAGYGLMVSSLGNEIEGSRFADLATRQVKDKYSFPSTTVLVHTFLAHLQRPVAESLEPLLASYRVGLETGELNFGAMAVCNYAFLYIFSGSKLKTFIPDMRNFACQLRLCGQDNSMCYVLPMLQLAMNLCAQTDNAVDLSWGACVNQHAFSEGLQFDVNSQAVIFLDYAQMFNAYILNDLDIAREAGKRANQATLRGTHFSNAFHAFIDGLVYLALYRRDRENKKYLKTANHAISRLTDYAKKRSINCLGMLLLLQAEKSSLSLGKHDAKKAYNEAISQLNRSGFGHFAAIANERAGEFMEVCNDSYYSEHYFSKAAVLYDKWGASQKTKMMAKRNSCIRLSKDHRVLNISLRGSDFDALGADLSEEASESFANDNMYGYGEDTTSNSPECFPSVRLLI
jgi:hypothetical protein